MLGMFQPTFMGSIHPKKLGILLEILAVLRYVQRLYTRDLLQFTHIVQPPSTLFSLSFLYVHNSNTTRCSDSIRFE
jgi:hypothetical protein